ncbi:hypothetical protein K435DRAFT_52258 [Dendrothele bispora CBS 962.96]|uniref:Uncharacterized protein n=1 Tax=Dendrothele bispora (strain CBS 962.96) TaxID=1314807 RepID=A0A4S8M6X4_DENBC|nr:hypothetical protein K435DRAFT_52258 [Dendrothele bispora CBS 962.96]
MVNVRRLKLSGIDTLRVLFYSSSFFLGLLSSPPRAGASSLSKDIYLQRLRGQLHASGNVKFVRRELRHISEVLEYAPKDSQENLVVVNATGCGAKYPGSRGCRGTRSQGTDDAG